ncbi:TIM-barrel domain-containing protein [Microbacterium amylolyticum]|uniref:Alpha-glucosidase (Family GH31 glycosyl hydrolase) n=1 Tax=Microbacterium amylolyticum TaxID=936337 RepID=A0ABS4ZKJ4_9MICO|nr:TIM-barrel domain-containing protein [Microbacterium amylolyticum]MBP2437732.1 alpha-glucosidase (family GH31 glycosyl hydrolase) [Microbacterium amylolyticum]
MTQKSIDGVGIVIREDGASLSNGDIRVELSTASGHHEIVGYEVNRCELGVELMVSIWPQISVESENFSSLRANNMLVRSDRGLDVQMSFQGPIVNLVRSAWAGSQRYGALAWSGDISSTWSDFARQITAGIHMGVAGIAWFTTDIGGFHGAT